MTARAQKLRTGTSDVGSGGLSASERTYRLIRERILSGELAPGTRLVDATLATHCGVSSEAFTDRARARGVLAEHEAIVEALVKGDPDKAEQVSREHLHNARMNLSLRHVQAIVDGSTRKVRAEPPTPIGNRPRALT